MNICGKEIEKRKLLKISKQKQYTEKSREIEEESEWTDKTWKTKTKEGNMDREWNALICIKIQKQKERREEKNVIDHWPSLPFTMSCCNGWMQRVAANDLGNANTH